MTRTEPPFAGTDAPASPSTRELGPHRRRTLGDIARRAAALALAVAATTCLAVQAHAQEYRLGAGDQVKLVVVEEPVLSGTYTLSETGRIVLPTSGYLSVGGMTLEAAASLVRTALSKRLVDPTVSLDIAQIRPFYIVGDVANPGAYPGQARLTLFKAVAIAGGFRRGGEAYQASINGIRAAESLVVARRQLLAAEVLKARVEAQLKGDASFDYALPQASDAEARAILEREQQTFTLQNASLEKQIELLTEEARVRDDEIAALTDRIEATATQLDALKEEIDAIQALVDKGLAQASRVFQLNREQGQLLSVNLQTTVSLNQARQARIQLELQLSTLRSDRRLELLARLQEATGTIDRLTRQVAADQSVLDESAEVGIAASSGRIVQTFRIQREDGAILTDLGDSGTAVFPGDVIEVRRTLQQD